MVGLAWCNSIVEGQGLANNMSTYNYALMPRSSAKLDFDNYDNIMMKIGARPTQNGWHCKR